MPTIIDGTAGITFPNSTVQASAGQVLQVVYGSTATSASSSTSTFADTGLTATITPRFATSKILVLVSQNGLRKSVASLNNCVGLRLLRNSTDIITFANFYGFTQTTLELIVGGASVNFLDSPATTSATTYKTQFNSSFNTASVIVQDNGATSTITLLEIAG